MILTVDGQQKGKIMERVGGCLCGETRYEIVGDPVRVIYCHCNDCKKQTSAPYSIVASYAKEQVSIQKPGFLKTYESVGDSGMPVKRTFCSNCGSPIFSEVHMTPEMLHIKAGGFDDMSWLEPSAEIYTKDKVRCANINQSIDSYAGGRPRK